MAFQSTTACFLTFILPLHSWDYIFSDTEEGPFFWSEEYEYCGGDTQSPINIDDDTVLDGFNQFSSKLSSFNISKFDGGIFNNTFLNHWDWNGEFLHHFYVLNNDHSISLTPVNSEGNKLNTKENGHIAKLSNIFSEYNNNISYCLNEFHFHWGEYNTDGSEHTINGIQYPFEVHFVHYRCDFDNISHALKSYDNENENDKYVLAVVSFVFEVNESATTDETNVLTEIIEDIESLHQDDDFIYIANINLLGSILPYDMEYISNNEYDLINRETSNMYYYEGSLTTPTCDEVVRWHIFNNHKPKITSDILSYFRNLNGTHGILSHNWRPVQDNINPVYSFTFGDSDNSDDGNSQSGSSNSGNSSGSSGGDNESSTVEAMPFVLLGILILVLLCVLICIYYQNKNRPQQSEEEEFANVIKMSESPPAGNDTAQDGYNNDHNTNNHNTNSNNYHHNNNHYYNAISDDTIGNYTNNNNYNNGNNIDNNRYNASIEIFDRNENNKRLITHINNNNNHNNNNNNDNDNDNDNGNKNRYESPSVGDEMVETEMKQNTFSSAVIAGEVNSSSNGNGNGNGNGHAPSSHHHQQHSNYNGTRNDSVTGTVTAPRQSTSKDNTIANNNNNNNNNNNSNNKPLGGAVNNMTRQATDEIAENEIDDALKLFDDGEDTVDQTKKRYVE